MSLQNLNEYHYTLKLIRPFKDTPESLGLRANQWIQYLNKQEDGLLYIGTITENINLKGDKELIFPSDIKYLVTNVRFSIV